MQSTMALSLWRTRLDKSSFHHKYRASILFLLMSCILGAVVVYIQIPRLPPITGEGADSTTATSTTNPTTTIVPIANLSNKPLYDPAKTLDPWKVELYQRLDKIRKVCGILCRVNTVKELEEHSVAVPGSPIRMVNLTPVDCPAILAMEEIDASDHTVPEIPAELLPYFTFNGDVKLHPQKLKSEIQLGVPKQIVWTEDRINKDVQMVQKGKLPGTYGVEATNAIRDDISDLTIRNKSILVIGTQKPWLEAILLHHGAAKVTTLEYSDILSQHPKLETLQPFQFRERFVAGTLEQFDGIVSYSSLEHSGLGRYGDALNPWGDILAVARAWCVTTVGGFLYLGVPTGVDAIQSNWHRIYGVRRWPLVAANWKPLTHKGGELELKRGLWESWKNGGSAFKFVKV